MALEKADLVLHEGVVMRHPASDSVAVAGGRIVAHGPFDSLKGMVGPSTHLIRLAGRTVAPGFIDCHLHFLEAASAASGLAVWRCRTMSDLLSTLRVAAARTPPGNWLRAFGCDEALLTDRRGPTRQELDQTVPKNPLRLRHQTLHGSWLNSRAITALGLEAPDFVPPAGATLITDLTGRLTGLVFGMEEWITRRLPRVTAAELEARARLFSRELASAGVTAFTDATARNGAEEAALFARLLETRAIVQRAGLMIGAAHIDEAGQVAKAGGGRVRFGYAKFLLSAGDDQRSLALAVKRARNAGLGCAFHATDVEELEAAVAAIETVRADNPKAADGALAYRIEHGGLIPPNFVDRIAQSGAWVVTNPGFAYYRGAKYAAEPGLLPYLYRIRSLLDVGIPMAAGTDAPVTPARPLVAIAAAAIRVSLEGYEAGLGERVTLSEGLDLFTANAAPLSGLNCGDLAAGRMADLIVMPRDPLTLKPSDLMTLPVDLTIVGGRVVYERGRPEIANSDSADLYSS